MSRATERLKVVADQARSGDWRGATADLRRWVHSDTVSAQMRRDFSVPFEPTPADVALTAAPASPNGNTVSVEQQVFKSAEAAQQHQMALTVYSKSLEMMKLALGRRS